MLFGQQKFDTVLTTATWQLCIGSGAKDVRSSLASSRSFKPSLSSVFSLAVSSVFSFVEAFVLFPSSKLPSSVSFSPPSSKRALKPWRISVAVCSIFTLSTAFNPSIQRETLTFWCKAVAMEGKKASWRLLISMDSSIIIEMNRLLQQCHVDRIRMTPFMWCVNINNPVEVNLKLLKVMVSRWVGNDNSFRVSQKLVPFRVVDVLMSLGLEIGGLEIPFDEVVGGLVGEMKSRHVCNMPFGVLDDLDRLCLYDWCTGVHKHIVENLNKCKKKIMGAGIPQSVTLSGNVAVLQAWAVERLSLHGHPSHRFFPRIMRWFPFKSRTEKIENIFMTGDLNMEWYIRNEDRHRPEIHAAFNMDDGGMSEGSLGEGSKVDKDDDEDESSDDGAWEAGAEERLRKNNEHIRALNAKIGVLTRELFEIYQTPIFHEEDACATDEEVGGGGEENAEVGGEEEGDGHGVGGEENAEVGGEEEGDGNEVDDPLGAHAEVRGDDETVGNINFIEIEDDGDEGEPEVVPLAIPPLRSFVGDPSTSVDVNQLYTAVSIREMNVHRVVSEIIGQSLSTTSIYTLAPMKYVDNMHHILTDYRKRPQNRHVFTLHNYNTYLRSDHFGLEELPTADFLFLPFVHDDHWWCYSVKLRSMEIFVIDSLGKGIRDRKRIDTAVAENMARFFCILMNIPEGSIGPLTVKQANIPSQPNLHDCGVIMLKAMEIWDGDEKYNGKSMPEYTIEELLGIRKKYVCDWILDNENISRMEALHLYGIV
ncbi:uncharacterized protein HKW66_Vig0254270 [Vigna angularis]|uniref:Ubiquitin-like protease family profile domain-containing protein n=1 Tax=Phaseolus angularis TaxID=3914 RepID=A0A8T0K4J4_PHAAN|nr:uncharacterized protein HKW66_Vig0254270 [Vigna angularis]